MKVHYTMYLGSFTPNLGEIILKNGKMTVVPLKLRSTPNDVTGFIYTKSGRNYTGKW